MTAKNQLLSARLILTVIAAGTIVLPYLADWNATHIYNSHWPPHAKFHNAQTMVLGTMLGIAGLAFTWWRAHDLRTKMIAAWLFTGFYWTSQLFAFAFPGVAWTDPDLLPPGHALSEFPIQLKGDIAVYLLLVIAAMLALRATAGSKPVDTLRSERKS
jgi:hypothetical protein